MTTAFMATAGDLRLRPGAGAPPSPLGSSHSTKRNLSLGTYSDISTMAPVVTARGSIDPDRIVTMWERSERLTLRELQQEDLPSLLAYRERSQKERSCPGPGDIDEEWLHHLPAALAGVGAPSGTHLAIHMTGESRLIGVCQMHVTDANNHLARVSIDFDARPQIQRYASEAAISVIRFGFEERGLQHISSRCLSQDASTARMLGTAGMQIETVLPQGTWIRDQWWDMLVYSIQRDEWPGWRGE